jgi:hypothetical protein
MASILQGRKVLKRRIAQGSQGPELLSGQFGAQEAEEACRQEGYVWRERSWGPLQTLWTFLLQVLHAGSSCRSAVAMALGQQAAEAALPGGVASSEVLPSLPSPDPSAYCQARQRVPLGVFERAVRCVGQKLQQRVGQAHAWLGRRVWLVDGTTCSMPDTPELQAAFGQPTEQAPGCGFPVAKVVAMFCWASGAVLEAVISPWRQHELHSWRTLWGLLQRLDVVVADRLYCTYMDLAGLVARGCDGVFRLHQRRPKDFRQGKRLGKDDRLITWRRPLKHNRPRGLSVRQWRRLPETMAVRVLRFRTGVRGFRSRCIYVATSLLDPAAYPLERIAALYRDRWMIELRFRDIKITLGMDVLRGKTPDVVRKEILMHLLAYNLLRALMWQAAVQHGKDLHRLSFAGTVDRLNAFGPYLWLYRRTSKGDAMIALLLRCIAGDAVPDRPNRIEPRAAKRRPKQYARLNQPRHQLRRVLQREASRS